MIYVIHGHSGSGKSTLASNLEKLGFTWVKTVTTRPPRYDGEEGYVFISPVDYIKYTKQHELIAARDFVTTYDGKQNVFRYGIPVDVISNELASGNDVIVISDAIGVDELFDVFGSELVKAVYLSGDEELLKRRAMLRDDFDEVEYQRRFDADNGTLSQVEFKRRAMGDKFIRGYRYYQIDIRLNPEEQLIYFIDNIVHAK